MKNFTVINHPLIRHKLTQIRDKDTSHSDFRRLLKELTGFMLYEVMADFPMREVEVETPLERATCLELGCEISCVLILRAALGMEDAFIELVPEARIGHVGLYRNEETLEPVEYYVKLPKNVAESAVIVVDPMLATGNSATKALDIVKKHGAKTIKFVSLVAAPEGVAKLTKSHPDVSIYTASLDRCLNEKGYIMPGLGDAGDRLFGTK
ncbi:MAG: uracil phosphoribosyltransferase [Lentisphaerae bacterium]|nr:uracil phosphoribosyltransferase [Lentisphaerota bacterium]MCP4102281.1 uracil phosphoribosyltransferase [Lentisphaerota bacterium]